MKEQYQKPKAVKVEFDYEEQLTASYNSKQNQKVCDITKQRSCYFSTNSLEFSSVTETEDYVVEEPVVELPGEEVYEEAVPTTPSVED